MVWLRRLLISIFCNQLWTKPGRSIFKNISLCSCILSSKNRSYIAPKSNALLAWNTVFFLESLSPVFLYLSISFPVAFFLRATRENYFSMNHCILRSTKDPSKILKDSRQICKGSFKILASSKLVVWTKKEPIYKYTGPSANLGDLRLACICLLGLCNNNFTWSGGGGGWTKRERGVWM